MRELPDCVSAILGIYHVFQSDFRITFAIECGCCVRSVLAITAHNIAL